MAALIHPLITLLASLTRQELAKQVAYLRTENRILRSKLPQRIELSNHECSQLVKHGKSLGTRIRELISVVSYSTFRRWVREMEATPKTGSRKKVARAGRPRVKNGVHDATIRIRKETGWGYTKIVQATRRLGHTISRQTVKNVLVRAGLGPEPQDHPQYLEYQANHLIAVRGRLIERALGRAFVESRIPGTTPK
jgi:putative transposase